MKQFRQPDRMGLQAPQEDTQSGDKTSALGGPTQNMRMYLFLSTAVA